MIPVFPVTLFSRGRKFKLFGKGELFIEEEVFENQLWLEDHLEEVDTREDPNMWLVDSQGQMFDVKLNHLMGETTEFFERIDNASGKA